MLPAQPFQRLGELSGRRLDGALADNGLAAQLYTAGSVTAKVGENGVPVTLSEDTQYPFDDTIRIAVRAGSPVEFPLYYANPFLTVEGASLQLNGKRMDIAIRPSAYVKVTGVWKTGDRVEIHFPSKPKLRNLGEK